MVRPFRHMGECNYLDQAKPGPLFASVDPAPGLREPIVIITTNRDDSTVLSTLNVRQLNPNCYIVAAVREADNVPLVRQSGGR